MANPQTEIEIDAAEMAQSYQLVVRVKKFGRIAFRFRVVGALMAIASRVAPCDFLLVTTIETCEAGYACGDVDPYGFVPEDGCPIHDQDETDKRVEMTPEDFRAPAKPSFAGDSDDPSGSEFNDYAERYHHGD